MALTAKQIAVLRRTPVAGNRIAKAIELCGVTQTAVAAATGLPYTYVSDVARCRYHTITVDNAHKFTAYFGCTIEDLFPRHEEVAA